MSPQYRQLLLNEGAIRINQDPLGQAGNLVRRSIDGSYEVWAKALSTDSTSSNKEEERTQYKTAVDEGRTRRARSMVAGARLTGRYATTANTTAVVPASMTHVELPVPNFKPWPYHAVLLLNRASYTQNITLDFYSDLYSDFMCPSTPPPNSAKITDAWNGKKLGVFVQTYTANNVPPHGSVLMTVRLVGQ